MTQRDHFSHSQLNLHEMCAAAYEKSYVEGIKVPPGGVMIRGISVAKSIEVDLRRKIETGHLLPGEEAVQTAVDKVKECFSEEVFLDPDESPLGKETVRGKMMDTSAKLARMHHEKIAPGVSPKEVEGELRFKPAGIDKPLLGYFDLLTKSGQVIDYKTTARSPGKSRADESNQLTLYDLGVEARYGKRPSGLGLHHLVVTPTGITKAVYQPTKRNQEQRQAFIERVGTVLRSIEAGVFPPTGLGSWKCCAKWCGYHPDNNGPSPCKYVARSK